MWTTNVAWYTLKYNLFTANNWTQTLCCLHFSLYQHITVFCVMYYEDFGSVMWVTRSNGIALYFVFGRVECSESLIIYHKSYCQAHYAIA